MDVKKYNKWSVTGTARVIRVEDTAMVETGVHEEIVYKVLWTFLTPPYPHSFGSGRRQGGGVRCDRWRRYVALGTILKWLRSRGRHDVVGRRFGWQGHIRKSGIICVGEDVLDFLSKDGLKQSQLGGLALVQKCQAEDGARFGVYIFQIECGQ